MQENIKQKNQKAQSIKSASFFNQTRWQVVILAVFIFALYGRTLSYDFIGLDEPTLIFDNYSFIKDPSNISQAFKQHVFEAPHHTDDPKDYYRPMLIISFMLDAQFSPDSGPQPKFFHFFNILYHIIASILLLTLLKKLKTPLFVAFTLTLLFSAHPLLTQAIAWIPGRNDSLIAVFALISFIYFIDTVETKQIKNISLHLLFFAFALFTKESAVGIAAICFFYLIIFNGEFFKTKEFLYLFFGYVAILFIWFFMREAALSGGSKGNITANVIITSLGENIPLFLQYLQKCILPFNLSVMSTVEDTNYILGILTLLLIGAAFYFGKKEYRPMMIFGMGWFLLFLTPSLIAKFFEGLEHRVYLPMIGLIVFLSVVPPFQNFNYKWNKYILIGLVAIFSVLTYSRLPVFSNRLVYWKSAIENSNHSSLACLNLGKTYETMGKYNEAIDAYREGLKRDPNQKLLHNNIGGAYIYMKRYTEAEVEIKKEMELHPDNNFADYNMGLIKKLQGNPEEGFKYFKKSVEKDTNFLQGYQQLADHYKKHNDTLNFERCIAKIKSAPR